LTAGRVPICLAWRLLFSLTALTALMSWRRMELRQARNVLVCLRWGIGDLVMELPLLQALRQHVPQARITGLGADPAVELLEGDPALDAAMPVQRFGIRHWGDDGTATSRAALAQWCRRSGFDCALDRTHAAQGVQRVLWELALPEFDTSRFDRNDPQIRDLDGGARLAVAAATTWGVPVAESARPVLTLRDAERGAAAQWCDRAFGPEAPLVGVAPIASSPLKRGAVSQFARVADALALAGARVAVFAGDQVPVAEATITGMQQGRRAALLPAMHLRQTAALLQQCRVLVCNDTGLMHLAAAVGTPVVAVFACTSPRLYLPRGGTAIARWRNPCGYTRDDDFGVAPCVAEGRCLEPAHQEPPEQWAPAAVAAALDHLQARPALRGGPGARSSPG
jgi:ADP-heptose:LPS heptosyltransferase